jgi:hypothetical protein
MRKRIQRNTAVDRAGTEEKVESRLACFVNAVKTNLCGRVRNRGLAPATIRNAEELKEKFKAWGSHPPGSQRAEVTGNHLYMDYLMHHRIELATEILKSMADGHGLSRQREKVLRNSIDYIEQRL